MITRLPSNQKPYDLYWTGDPALLQPPTEPAEDADSTVKARYSRDKADYDLKLKLAYERGQWDELVIPGRAPTKFVMHPVRGTLIRRLADRMLGGRIGKAEMKQLAFRMAVESIENCDEFELGEPIVDREYGAMAAESVADFLDGIDLDIVTELGGIVIKRAQESSPKS